MSGVNGPRTYKAPPTFVTPGNPSFALYTQNEEWDASAWFQALTRVHGPPGAKTAYDEARPQGFHADTNTDDFTSFVYGQAEVTEHHWPDVMYLLRPPPEREAYLTKAAPGQLHDSMGRPMVEKWPIQGRQARPLKELAGLPNNISSNETWDRMEFWRRLNPRILMEDILMRMHPDQLPRTTVGDTRLRNSLNMRASRRAYPEYCLISWFGKGLDGGRLKHTARDETLQRLTPQQIAANTTRGSTPGLVSPQMGERPGNRIELPSVTNACLTRRCGGRQAISRSGSAPRPTKVRRTKAGMCRKRSRTESEDEEDEEEEEEDKRAVTKLSRKKARKGRERIPPQQVDIIDDLRDKIGTFKKKFELKEELHQLPRESMPPGTFTGPPDALVSRNNQEELLSLEQEAAPIGLAIPLDPALLEPTGQDDDGLQSPEYTPDVTSWFSAQFEANLPDELRGWLGTRHPGVRIVAPDTPPPSFPPPFAPPPGTCDPRTIMNSPGEAELYDHGMPVSSSEEGNAAIEVQNYFENNPYDDSEIYHELDSHHDSNDSDDFNNGPESNDHHDSNDIDNFNNYPQWDNYHDMNDFLQYLS